MAMELIQKVTVASAQSSITFSGIPSSYKDLRFYIGAKGSASSNRELIIMEVNGDATNTNFIQYDWYQEDGGNGAEFTTSTDKTRGIAAMAQSNSGGGVSQYAFCGSEVWVNDYNNSSIWQAFYSNITHYQLTTSWDNWGNGVTWKNNAAITSIVFKPYFGDNFVTNSVISLYGIK